MTNGRQYQGKFANKEGAVMRFRCQKSYGQHYFERPTPEDDDKEQKLSVSICTTTKGAVVLRRSRYHTGDDHMAPTMRKFWLFDSLPTAVAALDLNLAGEAQYAEQFPGLLEEAKKEAELASIPEV